MKRLTAALIGVCLSAIAGSCTDPVAADPVPELSAITVSVAAATLRVGETTTATASGVDQFGAPFPLGAITWSSTSQVSVSASGAVTAVSPGAATVTATSGEQSGQSTLTVLPLPATGLALSTAPSTTAANRSALPQQPVVRLVNANGGTVSQAGVVVTANVSSGAIDSGGTATTDANGTATFSGLTLSGTSGARTITFSASSLAPISASVTLSAGAPTVVAINTGNQQSAESGAAVPVAPSVLITDADGNAVPNVSVQFDVTSGNGSLLGNPATSDAAGKAAITSWRLGAPGLNTLQARVANVSSAVVFSATATQAPTLSSVAVALAPSSIQVGQIAQATAVGTDQYGAAIATGAIAWSTNGAAASISGTGVVTGVSPGQVVVTATAGGKSGQAVLSVLAVPVLNALSLSIQPASIQAGQTAQTVVVGYDQFGAVIAVPSITWSSSSPTATVSSSGVITGVAAGSAVITATAGGKTAQANISIAASPANRVLTMLEMGVNPSTIAVGATVQASVTGRDQLNDEIDPGALQWSVTGAAVTVSQNGLITGIASGSAVVRAAASNGVSNSVTVTVTSVATPPPPPNDPRLTTLTVTVSPTTIVSGETAQASVQGFDQLGAPIAAGTVSYSVVPNPTGFIGINSSGFITTREFIGGTVAVVATSGTVSGQATLKIRTPATVKVTLSKSSAAVGETIAASVAFFDSEGQTMSFPFSFNVNCQLGCSGAATIAQTSATTFNVTAVKQGSVILVARSATGPGGVFISGGANLAITP